MIVCVCNNVSESKIQRAAEAGIRTMAELRTQLDVGTCCGKCAGCARKILREHCEKQETQSKTHGVHLLLHNIQFHANGVSA
ncbi:(2Fe-2S)-binding protein [Undibacterium sp. Dicai25W]|uniref:(2Fe-2S)-binding protein n=1 Tax=Undibacterium sp. Dicai25W TaxID=3413034 RepID=UPI003BEF9687